MAVKSQECSDGIWELQIYRSSAKDFILTFSLHIIVEAEVMYTTWHMEFATAVPKWGFKLFELLDKQSVLSRFYWIGFP